MQVNDDQKVLLDVKDFVYIYFILLNDITYKFDRALSNFSSELWDTCIGVKKNIYIKILICQWIFNR